MKSCGRERRMTGRKELIDSVLADYFYDEDHPGEWSVTLAGVKITNREAIKRYSRRLLEKRIPDVETFKTCEDFAHLKARCCDSCHGHYSIYDMDVVPLPEGGYAWVCGAVDRAIRPERHAEHKRFLQSKTFESNHDILRVAPYPWFVKQRLLRRRRSRAGF